MQPVPEVVPMLSWWLFGGLGLLALLLAIPALVVLIVSPTIRPVAAGAAKFLGWLALCLLMLGLCGWFLPESERSVVSSPAPMAPTLRLAERTLASGDLLPAEPFASAATTHDAQPDATRGRAPFQSFAVVDQRPDWVDQPAQLRDQTYRVEIKSGLYVTPAECSRALDGAIAQAVEQYVSTYFGDDRAAALVRLEPESLRQRLVKQPLYIESVASSVGAMQQLHALLEFDDALRGEMHRLWRQSFVFDRLRLAAVVFAGLLSVLAGALAWLKLAGPAGTPRWLRWRTGLAILLAVAGAANLYAF